MTATSVADRDLRRFLVGQVASVFGGTLTATAMSVIAVLVLRAGPAEVSLIVGAGVVPALLLGPVVGVLLDRVRRPRRMLIAADLTAASAVAAAALAGLSGALSVIMLIGLNLLLGTIRIVMEGLYFSHLHGLGVSDVGSARGRLQSSELLSSSVAGSAAGPLAAAVSVPLLFLGDALTYLISAACLLSLRSPDRRQAPAAQRRSIGREFVDGLRVVRAHPVLSRFVGYLMIGGAAASGVVALRAMFLLDVLRLPVALFTVPAVVTTLLGAAGALLAPRLLARGVPARRIVLTGVPAAAVVAAALPLASGPITWKLAAAALGIAVPVFFGALVNIALVTIMGEDIGDEYFARVTMLLASAATLAATLGTVAGGLLGESLGVRTGIWVCVGLGGIAAAVLVLGSRRTRPPLRHQDSPEPAIIH